MTSITRIGIRCTPAFSGIGRRSLLEGSKNVQRSDDLETGVLYCDDNLERLSVLPSESVDLIYLDPPFFSNKIYEVIWGDEAEVRSFEDRWEGGIQVYINWMRDRMMEMHRVLKPTGSLYLHCDPNASHYLKVMMDGVFGMSNFKNEVVWGRSNTRSSIGRIYRRAHDVILFYTKSRSHTFNLQYKELSEASLDLYKNVDERGQYQAVPLLVSGRRRGETGKPWRGIDPNERGQSGMHWITTPDKLEDYERQGLVVWPQKQGGVPRLKYYLDESPGVPLNDVWYDINFISSSSNEALGYPTQKPLALLERIITASSSPDDVVLDPFCGCGTSIAAAYGLNRRWVGIDISPTAVNIMKRRVQKMGAVGVQTIGLPTTEEQLRTLKPFEFQNWVVQRVNGVHSPRKTGDMGIDGFSFFDHVPIQIKRSRRVGRNVVDNFETAVERYGANKGYVVAFSFTRGAVEETARVKSAKGLEIELVTVKDLLLGTSELVAPVLNRSVVELPLPPARPKNARPTAEELVESDQHSEEVA